MKIVFKRLIAYIIDIVIVSVVSTLITSNSYINKDYNKYIDTYDKYQKYSEHYQKNLKELDKSLDDEKTSEKEYEEELNKLNNSFDEKSIDYNYKLIKLSIIPTIISILVILLYFVVIQFYMGGKTLGKKIVKLKVVSNNKKDLTIFNYFLRSLILNGVFFNSMSIVMVLVLSKNNYLIYNEIVYVINYILEMCIVFMMSFDKDNRGLHDYVANTKVIYEGENV